MAQFKILEKNHPKLYSKLYSAVENWSVKKNLPNSFWKYGLWRFKQIPKKISSVLSLDLSDFKTSTESNELSFLELEVTDCISYRITAIGSFSNRINLDTVSSALIMVGKVQYNRKLSFIRVSTKKFSVILYHDGSFKITFKKHDNLTKNYIQNIIENFIHTVLRAIECINCELCVGKCKLKAITINNKIIFVDKTKCTKCNLCAEACPIVTIVHKKVKGTIKQILIEDNLSLISI
jgi:ferredoxin